MVVYKISSHKTYVFNASIHRKSLYFARHCLNCFRTCYDIIFFELNIGVKLSKQRISQQYMWMIIIRTIDMELSHKYPSIFIHRSFFHAPLVKISASKSAKLFEWATWWTSLQMHWIFCCICNHPTILNCFLINNINVGRQNSFPRTF